MNRGKNILLLSNVSRQFQLGDTTVTALNNVNLSVTSGELLAVWGPSGSGKSTLLNLLGLLDQPDSGKVLFNNDDVSKLSSDSLADLRNMNIGFIYQSFNLVPVLSALENVMLPLEIAGFTDSTAKTKAKDWLDRVGLDNFLQFRPDRLSGGQRQRVAIARALVMNPSLILADEPTANLDSINSETIITLLEKLSHDTGVTCIFSTHDPRLLSRIPRQILLKDGAIEEDNLNNQVLA